MNYSPLKIMYSVKGNNTPIQFIVPPNPWLTTLDEGHTLQFTRPGLYYLTIDRSRLPLMFRDKVTLHIMDHAKNKIVVKGIGNQYIASIAMDPTEIGTQNAKISAHMTAPLLPAFNGSLNLYPISH